MNNVHEPDLMDLLNLHKKDIFNSFNCHQVVSIQSYNKATKTCKATVVYKKSISKRNPVNGKYEEVLQDYPILINCPVVNLSGGKAGLRFPIAKGDVAIIMFNDRDVDNWFLGKQANGATNTKRMHHFSDGVALVGLFSQNDSQKNYEGLAVDKDKTVLFDDQVRIVLSNNRLKITNKPTDIDTLGMLLQELILNINTALTTLTVAGVPSVVPGVTAINATAIKLQGLLE